MNSIGNSGLIVHVRLRYRKDGSMEKEEAIVLRSDEGGPRVVLLSRPQVDTYTRGSAGDYRLMSAIIGSGQVELYEAISGTDRYPPGRNQHVSLDFAEVDALIEAYTKYKAEQEKREAEYREAVGKTKTDDFDPFLDEGDLS